MKFEKKSSFIYYTKSPFTRRFDYKNGSYSLQRIVRTTDYSIYIFFNGN